MVINDSHLEGIIGFITDEESSSSESDEDITLLPQLIKETPERNTCIGDDVGVFYVLYLLLAAGMGRSPESSIAMRETVFTLP